MTRFGYFLSCEEYSPAQLVEQAVAAEAAGFDALWISDHFHPWIDEQGESPFVWGVIGALSQACSLPVTTAVTCPTVRLHPAIVAQAAATAAAQLEGRFTLGVGSARRSTSTCRETPGPRPMSPRHARGVRRADAAPLGGRRGVVVGSALPVDTARIYTLPDDPPPVYVSGFGPKATSLAARIGDGYISTKTDEELLKQFKSESSGKPAMAGTKYAYAPTKDEGVDLAHRIWPNAGLPGDRRASIPLPSNGPTQGPIRRRISTMSV